ncbi:ABC transporter substrate-binding protein [Sulfurimonas sp. HSL-3221]|uniref:Tgt2/MlaC family protein n=1 Tax=Sulfurimonadaceae TaxID=2771471 RepID=UPI001E348785|nr:ABC transporter substrate-binding protein [Sulfurimonas sp. HSL-3221]UFS61367.1 ABC transporter substrate-binding protein [Sulfurimonas sp. HSL-3221]
MKKLFYLALLSLLLPLSAAALEANEIGSVMRQKVDAVLEILNDHNKSKTDRNAAIEQEMDPYFDFVLMAKLSLGKTGWQEATPPQRKEYVVLFERRIKDFYMSKLDLYKDEAITLEAPRQVKNRIYLNSYIVEKGEKKEVLYKFYHAKEGWLIYDVDVLGVSIIQSYRSQFAGELEKGSIEQLLIKLRQPQPDA